MYTMTHTRNWSNAHLKAGCWYIDCGKIFCPVEEEDARKACVEADSKGASSGPNQGEEQDVEVEVAISQLPLREKNKILAKRARDKKKLRTRLKRMPKRPRRRRRKIPRKLRNQGSPSPPLLHFS
jgi:hypothetical protein